MSVTPQSSAPSTTSTPLSATEYRKRIFAILGASSGNLVEWFDFCLFLLCDLRTGLLPQGDATSQLLNTAGVFAAGFLMRPIGGWLFGRIADKHGRKTSMLISVLMMRRLAGRGRAADLRHHRCVGAGAAAAGTPVPGPVGGR
jgi:MHS family alpha-ketoglutarate permease-like MFS transporter